MVEYIFTEQNNKATGIIGISVIGKDHHENQDAFVFKNLGDNLLISVADGLGSCRNSATGARIAAKSIENWISEDLNNLQGLFGEIPLEAKEKLILRWQNQLDSINYSDYDSTLLFTAIFKDKMLIGGIGDGMILVLRGHEYLDFSWHSKSFSNMTLSLGSENSANLMRTLLINLNENSYPLSIVLSTDGISEDLTNDGKTLLPEYILNKTISGGSQEIANELNEWITNWPSANLEDDRTLVSLVKY